ncbi:MAG: excinuclease ABC subunit UvrA [Candidatus Falkowbacteria bacterium]|nr:excinuclease ABC subunit UvrA [Candidatus Falkowbacteria bacterium]
MTNTPPKNSKKSSREISKNLIRVQGARVHNLKNISIDIPRDKLVVITGLSGSGKSSLAFDTIYAEGQRRYVESLSAYARQFVGLIDKPDVDLIEGLSPAISIDQKSTSHNPRSTVGTVTEIYDYLRLLFARIGIPHCPNCHLKVKPYSIDEIIHQMIDLCLDEEVIILAPIIKDKKGEHKSVVPSIKRAGFGRVRFDGTIYSLEEFEDLNVDKQKRHSLEIVVDRVTVNKDKSDVSRLTEAVEKSLDLGEGIMYIWQVKKEALKIFSRLLACPNCGLTIMEPEPHHFSFNSPHGACADCSGLGTKLEVDPELVFNERLTIAQGGIKPWVHNNINGQMWLSRQLGLAAQDYGFDLNTPISELNAKQRGMILHGTTPKDTTSFEGIVPNLMRRYEQTESDYIRKEIESYMRILICPACDGQRLKAESLAVKVAGHSIHEVTVKSIEEARDFFVALDANKDLTAREKKISIQIVKEIKMRLNFLLNVGLDYLTLSRSAGSLSGGEAQRIRLATQIGSALMGVLYILDEPSIGLHQRDNDKLIETLKDLRDLGNTVIVVEHDAATMEASDYIIDIGPGAGEHGGTIVAAGTPAEIKKSTKSLTGQYLSGKKSIPVPSKYRAGNGHAIKIIGAIEHNLKNINVEIPLGKLVAITGVSGSGKSTLVTDILAKALNKKFYHAKDMPGKHDHIEGLEQLDKVIDIDQSPIGRTPRSNAATYTGLFTPIRDLFSALPEAKIRGYQPGRFSFNVVGGRCESCSGDGIIKIEMQFLPDVYVECDVCHGQRYQREVLEIHYKGKNISDVLNMTVEEAMAFFKHIPLIHQKLATLFEVGLGYIKLGQSATTLSGGEAQRIKLATELSRRPTGQTLYILDEPTTGLHFEDIRRLLTILQRLVDRGNTVMIIEHNLDVIKSVDWIIDLGPEGGNKGGEVVALGTPKEVAKNKRSYTGKYLVGLM